MSRPKADNPDMESAPAPRPVRLVVTDDLRRSRATVFFRLLLVIPAWIVFAFWSIAAFFVAVAAWFVILVRGRCSNGIHEFLATYLRYSVQVSAYMHLSADPYPGFGTRARLSGPGRDRRADGAAALDCLLQDLPRPPGHRPRSGDRRQRQPQPAARLGGLQRRRRHRRRLHRGISGLVRLRRPGAHAARPARPHHLRDRLLGTDERVSPPAHRPLPVVGSRSGRPDGAPRPSGRSRVQGRSVSSPAPRPLPAPPGSAAPRLVDALDRPGRARRARGLARGPVPRPPAAPPAPLPRRVRALRDARRRLPLLDRRAVSGVRRRPGLVSDRPAYRPARAAGPLGARVSGVPGGSGSAVVRGVRQHRLRRRSSRLVLVARSRPHAGGDGEARRRLVALPGPDVGLRPVADVAVPLLGAGARGRHGGRSRSRSRTCTRRCPPAEPPPDPTEPV